MKNPQRKPGRNGKLNQGRSSVIKGVRYVEWFNNMIYNFYTKTLQHKPKQLTFCYCPECRNELISSNSFVSDLYINGENEVTYNCTKCGHISKWNFDIAPIPILMNSR